MTYSRLKPFLLAGAFVVLALVGIWKWKYLPPVDAQRLTRAQFSRHFSNALEKRITTARIDRGDRLSLEVRFSDSDLQLTVSLDNAWARCADKPLLRQQTIDDVVSSIVEHVEQTRADTGSAEAGIKIADVLPVVRSVRFLEAMNRNDSTYVALHEPLTDDLCVMYVQDLPKSSRFLTKRDLTDQKIDLDALRSAALENLRAKSKTATWTQRGPVKMLHLDGNYEASMLVLDDFWTSVAVDGEVVVAVPARDLCLITGTNSADGIAKLREIAAQSADTIDHPVSSSVYVRSGNKWKRM